MINDNKYGFAEIGKEKQANGPTTPLIEKLWAISEEYKPLSSCDGLEIKKYRVRLRHILNNS